MEVKPLMKTVKGESCTIKKVHGGKALLLYLGELGLKIGSHITIVKNEKARQSRFLIVGTGDNEIRLEERIADDITVKKARVCRENLVPGIERQMVRNYLAYCIRI